MELIGDIQSRPFDSFLTTVAAQAYTGADGQTELPTAFAIDGDAQGWHLAITPASEQPGLFTDVRIHRTVGIIAFGDTVLAC